MENQSSSTTMNFDFPPTMEGVWSHKSQVTVNDSFSHVKSQPQTIESIGIKARLWTRDYCKKYPVNCVSCVVI